MDVWALIRFTSKQNNRLQIENSSDAVLSKVVEAVPKRQITPFMMSAARINPTVLQ